MRVLGVDPGSRLTGYGCIDLIGNQLHLVTQGTLSVGQSNIALEKRLLYIYRGLQEIIQKYRPQVMAVEKIFFAKNAISALKLGQARGVVVLTGSMNGLEIAEYNPTEVKASITGYGRAEKSQVAKMIQVLLGKQSFLTDDASDALALAIHHAYGMISNSRKKILPRLKKKKNLSLAQAVGFAVKRS